MPDRDSGSSAPGQDGGGGASGQTGPVGRGEYVVKQGDCIESIAIEHGLFWQTIWDDPANRELREARKGHNVLLPGDRLHVRAIRQRQEAGVTEQRHRFRRKGIPSVLRIVLRDERDRPRGNLAYVLNIDGRLLRGRTDGEGLLEHSIPPDARSGKLTIVQEDEHAEPEEYDLRLGGLDPNSEICGVQERLRNIGLYRGEIDGELGPVTEDALRAFQAKRDLPQTGRADAATIRKLNEDHGY